MHNGLFIAVTAGLSGMFGWGLADFFAKKTIDVIGDIMTLTWANIFGVLVLIGLLLGDGLATGHKFIFPAKATDILILAFFGALQAIVYLFVYRAFGKGKLALINPVFSSYSGLVVLLSLAVFGEAIGRWQLVAVLGVFIGILTVSLDEESFKLKRLKIAKLPGMAEALIGTLLAALWTVLWGHFLKGKDWLLYAAIMFAFMSITTLAICWLQRLDLRIQDKAIWKYLVLIGLAEVAAYVGVSIGYSLTSHVSIVAVLSAGFSIPTFILAYLFLGERINKFQKAGVFLVVLGVCLLPLL